MPYCPSCKQQFSDATIECPTDRIPLVPELPFQTIDGEEGTWVEIASASTDDESRLLAGFLEAQGISCQIESLRFDEVPVNLGSLGEIRVYVNAKDESSALELLRRREVEYQRIENSGDERVVTNEGPAAIDDESESFVESEES